MNQNRQIVRATEEAAMISERGQHVLNILKAGLSGVPIVGSPFATLMDDYIPSRKQQKLEHFIEDLAADVERIKDRIETDRVTTDEYAYIYEQCVRGVLENVASEKLNAFRAILLNSLTNDGLNFDQRDFYINLVRNLSHIHIRILSFLNDPETFLSNNPPSLDRIASSNLQHVAFSTGLPQEIVATILINDLENHNFFHNSGLTHFWHNGSDVNTVNNDLKRLVNDNAKRFIRFCTLGNA